MATSLESISGWLKFCKWVSNNGRHYTSKEELVRRKQSWLVKFCKWVGNNGSHNIATYFYIVGT